MEWDNGHMEHGTAVCIQASSFLCYYVTYVRYYKNARRYIALAAVAAARPSTSDGSLNRFKPLKRPS